MKFTIEMPEVSTCQVTECAYNANATCHARAITVGDGSIAQCDTFLPAGASRSRVAPEAGVGACKVSGCRHNRDLECFADAIQVGYASDEARCLTFEQKP